MTLLDEIKAKCSATLIVLRNDELIAAIVNSGRTKTAPIPRNVFAMWCGETGLRSIIQDAANTPSSPIRSIALTILDFLQGGVSADIDFSLPANQQMLTSFQTQGVITAEQVTALNTLTVVPDPVSVSAISDALNAGGY